MHRDNIVNFAFVHTKQCTNKKWIHSKGQQQNILTRKYSSAFGARNTNSSDGMHVETHAHTQIYRMCTNTWPKSVFIKCASTCGPDNVWCLLRTLRTRASASDSIVCRIITPHRIPIHIWHCICAWMHVYADNGTQKRESNKIKYILYV